MFTTESVEKIYRIFFPFFIERQTYIREKNTRFVHYTSADTAFQILKNKSFWMRNSSYMNDFSEIKHGLNCLFAAYQKEDGSGLKSTLEKVSPDFSKKVEGYFNSFINHFETGTYITCFSEHHDSEDTLGRLSMWRAYGGKNGVAIVIKNHAFLLESDEHVYASPVEYLDDIGFGLNIRVIESNILENLPFLQEQSPEELAYCISIALKFAVLCTKHPGFKEEKEWRVICSPTIDDVSNFLEKDYATVRGVPQVIYKIPLKDKPNLGLVNIELPALIDRIIIGPTDFALATRQAFISLLEDNNVEDAANKVFISSIPLRSE